MIQIINDVTVDGRKKNNTFPSGAATATTYRVSSTDPSRTKNSWTLGRTIGILGE